MKENRTREPIDNELRKLRLRVAELEKLEYERKSAEDDLREVEEKYRLHFENVNDVIYNLDSRLRIVDVSPSVERILGYRPQEVMNKSIRTISLLSPKSMPRAVMDALKVMGGKRVDTAIYEFIAKDGSRVIGEVSGAPVKRNGRIVGLVSIARDITARKAAEDALREKEEMLSCILETINEGILVLDPDFHYTYWNREMEILSKTSRDQVVGSGKKAWELFPHLREEGVVKLMRQAMRGKSISRDCIPFRLRDNSSGFTSEAYMPLKTPDGGVRGVVGVIRNITQQKKAEAVLKNSLREKEVLLQEIHHRVKNNMQIMTSLLRLQASNIEDVGVQEMFAESRNRIHSMALIHEKLYKSMDFTHINYARYVQTLVSHLFATYNVNRKDVELKLSLDDIFLNINSAIPCGLLINELVSNSLKHAFPGGRKGEIRVALHQSKAGNVNLVVGDTGVGFPKDVQWEAPNSLGMQIILDLIRQLDAAVEFNGKNGTLFSIAFRPPDHK